LLYKLYNQVKTGFYNWDIQTYIILIITSKYLNDN
jgi:hypothetical protein